jgi:hypothetical protein
MRVVFLAMMLGCLRASVAFDFGNAFMDLQLTDDVELVVLAPRPGATQFTPAPYVVGVLPRLSRSLLLFSPNAASYPCIIISLYHAATC